MRRVSRDWCLWSVLLLVACAPVGQAPLQRNYSHLLARGIHRGLPGMWLAAGTVDELAWAGAAGLSRLEGTVDAELDDRVHMGSITKAFTAVVALQLIGEGRLGLDDPVTAHLSDELVGPIPHSEEITVGQLLDHTSGIYGFNNDLRYLRGLLGREAGEPRSWAPADLVALAYEGVNEPFGRPGERPRYGDTNYVLLGLVLESVTGESLQTAVRERILEPLGLEATTYLLSPPAGGDALPPDRAAGYFHVSDELRSVSEFHPKFRRVRDDLLRTTEAGETITAAAALLTTAPDLFRFGRALFGGELLGDSVQGRLLAVADGLDAAPVGTERLGILRAYRKPYGVVVTSEGDGPGGSNSLLAYHPATGVVVAVLTNVHGLGFESRFFLDEVVAEVVRSFELPG
ncbi:MAG: serine hydrolase domain-containing protein [Thermoanaerobaculia bacterium]|nr:serine hydrolase domain-containing protein [Thermoanaerobaculia bacterium]